MVHQTRAVSPLKGERLVATREFSVIEFHCTKGGKASATFQVISDAAGPYRGSFIETGSFGGSGHRITRFRSDFTISNDNGTVLASGTKGGSVSGSVTCMNLPEKEISHLEANASTRYTATITGTSTKARGSVDVGVDAFANTLFHRFDEQFH